MNYHKKVIISGGGTGGHVFPAIAIANAIKKLEPQSEILFVGAEGKIEMDKVPAAGYKIEGLPVAGFQRRLTFKNVTFFIKLFRSMWKARRIVKSFKPDIAIGVGGYASGPVLKIAGKMKVPTLIQEQNSYAGVTNKLLAKKAEKICVAYEGMEKYFPANKIILTGNPVRKNLLVNIDSSKAKEFFGFKPDDKVIFVTGGSLGAGTINKSILSGLDQIKSSGIKLIWQTGKNYFSEIEKSVGKNGFINLKPFISEMDMAFAAANVIVSRAGAGTISELCLVGKPVVLVPSPNVAEDHQTKNAMSLSSKNAAILIKDNKAIEELVPSVLQLMENQELCLTLSGNIKKLAISDSDEQIAKIALDIINSKHR